MKLSGYVIVPPCREWESPDLVVPQMCYSTFSTTPMGAWLKQCHKAQEDFDVSRLIQYWHNLGYRVKVACLIIEYE